MSDAHLDPAVRRAVDELRRVPRTDHAAVSRVVAAAAAARIAPSDNEPMVDFARTRRLRRWTLAGVAAAAAFAGFALNNTRRPGAESVAATSAALAPAPESMHLRTVANSATDVQPIAKQFVFNSRIARRVSLVGDFNKWNPEAARMARAVDGDLWSITVPVLPGRHMYAFMVDDSIFVLDPREAMARDGDLGIEASVTIVGRP